MIVIVLLAFGLRAYQLDGQSLRGDEAASATYATFPLQKIIAISHTVDPHPPTFYLGLHSWEQLAGVSEFAVRFWTLIPAVLAVALIFSAVKQMVGRTEGLIAAAFLAINSFHIWHSQDLRSYTWLLLLGLVSSLALWRAIHERRRAWGWYGASLIILLYLHYYSVFIVAFQITWAIWWGWRSRRWQFLHKMALALAVAGGVFLPWLAYSWQFVGSFTGDFSPASPLSVLVRGLRTFSGGIVAHPPQPSPWTAAAILLASAGAAGNWRKHRTAVIFFLLYMLMTFLGIVALSARGQAFTERYLFAAMPGFAALVGLGTSWFWRNCRTGERAVGLALALIVVALNLSAGQAYRTNPNLAKAPQWRQLFSAVQADFNPATDTLFYNYPEASITYYASTRAGKAAIPAVLMPPAANEPPEKVAERLAGMLENYRRVWFVPVNGDGWDDTRAVETWLARHAARVRTVEVHWATAELYLTLKTIRAEMTPVGATFANGFSLAGVHLPQNTELGDGDSLGVTLVWTATAPSATPLTVFVQLIDPAGFRRGGYDNQPVRGTYPTTDWLPDETVIDQYTVGLDDGAPSGEYRLWVGMYDALTGARISVVDDAGNSIADHVVLPVSVRVK